MGIISRAAEIAENIGRSVMRGPEIDAAGRAIGKHIPIGAKVLIGGAVVAGAVSTHPLREPFAEINQDLYGDPLAIKKLTMASIAGSLAYGDDKTTQDVLGNIRNPTSGRSIGSYAGNPSGSIVMGMYNLRTR